MAIAMDPERVESAKAKVNDVKEAFSSALTAAASEVDSLFSDRGLEGQAANAFQTQFEEANNTFQNSVIPQIEGIATMLNSIKDGLEQTDLSIAQGMSG